jgi:hypothetical protein
MSLTLILPPKTENWHQSHLGAQQSESCDIIINATFQLGVCYTQENINEKF